MYICIVKTKKICIYMSYIIHGPGQCAIFPQPTCFRSFRNIPLIKLFFWGQFGSGQCKKKWPLARIPFNDTPWHLNWVGCRLLVNGVYWRNVVTPVISKKSLFDFWPLPPPKQECGTKIKHFHQIWGEGVSTAGLRRVLHPKNQQISLGTVDRWKVHPQVTYFNTLTFGSFQIQRRNHSTNQGIIWVLVMCPQNLVHIWCAHTCVPWSRFLTLGAGMVWCRYLFLWEIHL